MMSKKPHSKIMQAWKRVQAANANYEKVRLQLQSDCPHELIFHTDTGYELIRRCARCMLQETSQRYFSIKSWHPDKLLGGSKERLVVPVDYATFHSTSTPDKVIDYGI